eukprot:2984763-Amphidinium_carterae.1
MELFKNRKLQASIALSLKRSLLINLGFRTDILNGLLRSDVPIAGICCGSSNTQSSSRGCGADWLRRGALPEYHDRAN